MFHYPTTNRTNELILLRVQYDTEKMPVCLPHVRDYVMKRDGCWFLSWQRKKDEEHEFHLKQKKMTIYDSYICRKAHNQKKNDNHIFCSFVENYHPTPSDFGGPIMFPLKNGHYTLIGILSNNTDNMLIFFRVIDYLKWIESIINYVDRSGPIIDFRKSPYFQKYWDHIMHVKGKWPWVVSVQINRVNICGGLLISEQFVLTGAHCLMNLVTKYEVDITSMTVVMDGIKSKFSQNKTYGIVDMYVHENFDIETFDNDIAILRLTKKSSNMPICLPKAYENHQFSKKCWIASWVADEKKGWILKDRYVKIVSNFICDQFGKNQQNKLCVLGGSWWKASKMVDPTGPIFCGNKYGRFSAIGTMTKNHRMITIFTSIHRYIGWIDDTIKFMRNKQSEIPNHRSSYFYEFWEHHELRKYGILHGNKIVMDDNEFNNETDFNFSEYSTRQNETTIS
ncbi:hypothetical protein SNEBB_009628 [Seison nebaliae]|nr:hypothetical protein SNEBB_009628 [Seison nebaliae]